MLVTIWREHFGIWRGAEGCFEPENGVRWGDGGVAEGAVAVLRRMGMLAGMTDAISSPSATAVPAKDRAVAAFAALGERERWKVARLLAKEPMLSATELMARTGMSKSAASRQLMALWRAGLTERYAPKDDGRARVYRLTEVGAGLVQAGILLDG